MKQYQHGDVLIQRVDKLPKGVTRLDKNGILVEGEHTGHAHRVDTKTSDIWVLDNQLYLEVVETTPITHEEHKKIDIPPGIYQIGIVKEYDYTQDMERRVVD